MTSKENPNPFFNEFKSDSQTDVMVLSSRDAPLILNW